MPNSARPEDSGGGRALRQGWWSEHQLGSWV